MNFNNLTFSVLLRIIAISLIVVLFCQNGLAADHSLNFIEGGKSQVISKSMRVKKEGFKKEKIIIFEGDVRFNYKNKTVSFYGDKMILGFKVESQLKYFQMLGNVKMEKGNVYVSSKEAHSENLNAYVDFFGNVTFSTNGSSIKVNIIRYSFITEIFSVPEYGG